MGRMGDSDNGKASTPTIYGTPEQFQKMQIDEYSRLAKLIKEIGMKPL